MIPDIHNQSYYFKCMAGGILSCGLTHTAIIPWDIARRNRIINMNFGSSTLIETKKLINNGGFAATLIGYSLRGLGRYGFYEIFKDVFKNIIGQENAERYKIVGWSIASGSAEIIANILLCPWEVVRLKIQHSRVQYSSMLDAINKLRAEEGFNGFYKGLIRLWSRQVPYTIIKFVAFEWFSEYFYDKIFTQGKQNYSNFTQSGISFASGYSAGIFCAIVSHPFDTILSKLYSRQQTAGSFVQKVSKIYLQIGFRYLWTGLGTRSFIIGTLTGLQWGIYDLFKMAVGLQTTGGGCLKQTAKD